MTRRECQSCAPSLAPRAAEVLAPAVVPVAVPPAEDADLFLARLEGLRRANVAVLPAGDAAALDALAVACARGGGAHEVAVGEGLDLLARSGGDVRLGYSCIGDLARERLGLASWQVRRLRRNAVALRERPRLRAAVLAGEVSPRKAELVLRVAVGPSEVYWVERAKVDTARRLGTAVSAPEHAEEDWHRIRLALPRDQAEVVDVALSVAKVVLGPTTPLWRLLWALGAEYLSTHPSEPLAPAGPRAEAPRPATATATAAAVCARPEWAGPGRTAAAAGRERTGREPSATATDAAGAHLARAAPSRRPDLPAPEAANPDPYDLLDQLTRLVADRALTEERLGRACLLVRRFGVARRLGWSCFDEWCIERLGLAPSTVYQRMALERRLAALPALREALRSRRLSYEQARLVARVATPADVAARIDDAAGKPCIDLVRDLEAEVRLQMCNAGELRASLPDEAESLLREAIQAARLHSDRPLSSGEALVEISRHFVETWAFEVIRLERAANPVILRDRGLCQVPGCSLPAAHVHHLWFRSQGGPLQGWNELSLCLPHHLLGVHAGSLLVFGRAPDHLTFFLGEREVAAARARGASTTPASA